MATDVFYEYELFRTISDNCFSVTFISDSENHKLHDFRESRELWSIWWKSIPKKSSSQGPFAKIDSCKEVSLKWFAKTNDRLAI